MKHATISLGDRIVGGGAPCIVVAEAGVNHNGDLATAKALVDAAHEAGADAVKFQTWVTEKLVTPDAGIAAYQSRHGGQGKSQFDLLKPLELSFDAFRDLKGYADRCGILFLSTPDEEDSADFLDTLGLPLFKIGSAEVTNLPFLDYVARKGKPVILSTGMSTLSEVGAAVQAVRNTGNRAMALLHCVSDYPAEPEACNLRAMETLRTAFNCPVGFSDHTLGLEVATAAVAMGACVIEKHFTLDKRLSGPDHAASLDPDELRHMVEAVRIVESALGDGTKRPSPSEAVTRRVVQKVIVAARAMQRGSVLEEPDMLMRRAGEGLGVEHRAGLVGRRLLRDVRAYETIKLEMVQ